MKRSEVRTVVPDRKPDFGKWSEISSLKGWEEVVSTFAPGTEPTEIQKICLDGFGMMGSRRNLIVSAPTNSGKSLVGYLFLFDALRKGKRALLLEPFRALAQEKYEELKRHSKSLSKFLGKDFTPRITTGDYALDEERMSSPPPDDAELVIATPERLEMILRNPANDDWVASFGAVCVDEAHLISDPKRGGCLEFLITSMKIRKSPPRFLLLSATLGSAERVLEWLDPCDLAESHLRWPPLKREILSLEEGEVPGDILAAETSRALVEDGAAVIVFVYKKTDVMKLSVELQTKLGMPVEPFHANLPLERKERVRRAFLEGCCRCVVSTTALGTGMNLPATHLIVRDTTFQPDGKISASQLIQMMGRAGRGSRSGHAMVLLKPKDEWKHDELQAELESPKLPELQSGFLRAPEGRCNQGANPNPGASLVLSILSRSGEAGMPLEELRKFAMSLLAGEQLASVIDESVRWVSGYSSLLAHKSDEQDTILPTRLGQACSRSGLPPTTAAAFANLLRDLLSVDENMTLFPQLSMLDLLLLAELLSDRKFLGGRFSDALAKQVDEWASACSEKSLLFNQWVRGREGFSKAEEIAGSLGISPSTPNPDWARQLGYLRMRAAAILWSRSSGISWDDIKRRWKVDPEEIAEEEWIRSRSHLISGFAEICDIRCFFYHLKEDCKADDAKIQKAKNTLRRLRAYCFKILGRLKYCSPLGPMLVAMKRASKKGVGKATIEKLETAGITTPKAIRDLSDEKARELGLDAKKLATIRSYLGRN
jgi:replicative superfamily II helicase